MARDLKAARAFAIKCSTSSEGDIANLGGAFLRVEHAVLSLLKIWYCPVDDPGCPNCIKVRAIREMLGLCTVCREVKPHVHCHQCGSTSHASKDHDRDG